LIATGRCAEGRAAITKFLIQVATSYCLDGNAEAARIAKQPTRRLPQRPLGVRWLAVASAQLGRIEEGREAHGAAHAMAAFL